ncbi:MAG: hypothetical protein FIA91_00975 [Geobacter sp.]|nr:hypothetical protein [Geobacter sp.]
MKKSLLLLTALLAMTAANAFAWDITIPGTYAQGEFKDLTKELGSAIAYRNLAPAEPLGITGFDVAAQVSAISLDNNSDFWKKAAPNAPSYAAYPSIRARKGLPFSIDVGAMYTYVPSTDIKVYGFEVSKAILDGTMAPPAVGIRGSYTKLTGISDLSLQTVGFDASISKGFLFLTPYAGAGMVWIDGKYDGNAVALKKESMWQPRGFAGLKVSPLPLVGITGEVEYAARPIYSLKLGLSF